jgi:CubicO group peptidase (beta-lactamase class C family)
MRVLILSILIVTNLSAQELGYFADPDRAERVASTASVVKSVFQDHFTEAHLPGLVYGVVLDGKLLFSGGFGYANLEEELPADERSLFRIASMSKSFTALAILQLRDEGKLRLDDPASKYVPEMMGLNHLTSDAPQITIRHLLTHAAGFPEDNPWGDRQLADTDEELRELVRKGVAFSDVPGIEYEYSNLGFALLGQIVQAVSGMEFQAYMKEHVFTPLGMNSTVYEYDQVPRHRLALGYNWRDGSWVNIPLEHHGAYGAMGGLITTIEDFSAYVALHLSAWPPRSGEDAGPLKRSSLREMHHPWNFSSLMAGFRYPSGRPCASASAYAYGLRWMVDCQGRVLIGHSGGLPGFGSNWTMMPDYGLAVMSFDNRTYGGTSTVNTAVLDTILAMTGLERRRVRVSEILEKRKEQLLKMFPDWEGAEVSGIFAENFFMDNRLSDLVNRTRELFEEAGTIMRTGALVAQNQLRGTFVLMGEKKSIEVFFTLSPEKDPLIQQLQLKAVDR